MSEAPIQAWPFTLEEFWSWHVQAACRQVDTTCSTRPRASGGHVARREAAAKQICGSQGGGASAAYAIATREPYGTWGGLSENDRRDPPPDRPAHGPSPAPAAPWPTGSKACGSASGRAATDLGRRSRSGRLEVAAPGRAEAGPPAGPGLVGLDPDAGPLATQGRSSWLLSCGLDPVDGGRQHLRLVPSGTPLTSWKRSPSGVCSIRMSPGRGLVTAGCSRACGAGGPRAWSRTSPGPG